MRLVTLLIAVAAAASGQTGPEILQKAADTYRSLKSYRFEAQEVEELASESSESRTRATLISAASPPNLRRLETKGGPTSSLRVYDGQTVWEFRPGPNQFARFNQAAYSASRGGPGDPVDPYKTLDKDASDAKLMREETIAAAGGQRPCWVVEVPQKFQAGAGLLERSPTTYWIDKSTYLVLKQSGFVRFKTPRDDTAKTQTSTVTFSVARINEPIPEELFHFQQPQDASEVADFTRTVGAGQPLANSVSPDFVLQDLEGKDTALSSFKGKPVLVDFWAVWCEPCREQMPKIQEAQRLFSGKGLIVLAINDGETPEAAGKYIREHGYSFPVLLDPNRTVADKFSVAGIPSLFLIDGDGHVRAQFTGYSPLVDLKEELKKIGVQ
jgi:peroxiredoxin/outer membrane lipoprotein-sorting protein